MLDTRNGIEVHAKDVMDTPLEGIVTEWRKGGKYISFLGEGDDLTDSAFVKTQIDNDGTDQLRVYYLKPSETVPGAFSGVLQRRSNWYKDNYKPGDIAEGVIYRDGYGNGFVTNPLDYNGASQGNRDIVVFYKAEAQPTPPAQLASNIEEATATQTVTRDVEYKNNGNDGQPIYNDLTTDDPNSTEAKRNEASGLDNIDVPAGTKTQQTITLTGTAYFDKTTGKFVQAKEIHGTIYAVDSQGRPIVYDSNNNLVIGNYDETTGKVTPTNERANYLQGGFNWKIDSSNATGWTAPTVNGYKNVPGSIPALDTSIKVKYVDSNGYPIISGNATPTLQEVINYLNSQANTNQDAVSQDVIKDATDYPTAMGNLFPQLKKDTGSQYIFDQYQLTNGGHQVITLAVDRNDPNNGNVYVYVTNADQSQILTWDRAGHTYWNTGRNGSATYNFGNGISVTVKSFDNKFNSQDQASVSISTNNANYTLKRIFGYGAQSTDASSAWGDFKPREITQTIKYVDADTGQEVEGYPEVQMKGLIGQHFDASGVNPLTIAGYQLQDTASASGSISDYEVGQHYIRTWYDPHYGDTITEDHQLIDNNGDMHTSVHVVHSNGSYNDYDLGTISQGEYGSARGLNYSIQNPYVSSTSTVVLKYKKNSISADQNPFYVVYTPEQTTYRVSKSETQEVHRTINYIDKTTGEKIPSSLITENPYTDQSVEFTRNIVIDNNGKFVGYGTVSSDGKTFTQATNADGWETSDGNSSYTFSDVDSPLLSASHYTDPIFGDGSSADTISGETVTADSADLVYNVYYGHQTQDVTTSKEVNRNFHYIFSDGTTASSHADLHPQATQTVTFNGTATKDLVTGVTGPTTWTPTTGTLASVGAQPVSGYTITGYVNANSDGSVESKTVDPTSSDIDVTIVYSKQPQTETKQKATVKIIDKTENRELTSFANNAGKQGETITFDGEPQTLKAYLDAGYKFDSAVNDDSGSSIVVAGGNIDFGKFDNNDNNVQSFTINLVHGTETKTERATTNAQVHYVISGGKVSAPADSTKQTINWTRTDTVDKVTGNITEGDWTKDKSAFDNVDSPTVTGYTPDKATVVFATPQPNQDQLVTVVYTPNAMTYTGTKETTSVTRTINYLDSENNTAVDTPVTQTGTLHRTKITDENGNLIGYGTVSADGHSYTLNNDWTIDNNGWVSVTSPDETAKGYKPTPHFSDGTNASTVAAGTISVQNPQDVIVNVYYDHDTVPVTPGHPDHGLTKEDLNKDVTRTIHYQNSEGQAVNGSPDGTSDYTQTAHFTRTAIIDKVNNQLLGYDTNGDGKVDVASDAGDYAWRAENNSNQFAAVNSKAPADLGYSNVDIPTVSSTTVAYNTDNIKLTVTYSKTAKQGAFQVHYIDEDNHDSILHDDSLSGKYGDAVSYDPTSQINALTDLGYVQDTSYNKANKYVPQTDFNKDNNGKVYVIAFKHGVKNGETEELVPTETIHFRYEDGSQAAPDKQGNAGSFKFTRTPKVDAVNGHIVDPGTWNERSFTFTDGTNNVPTIEGYTADKTTYGNKTATPTNLNVEDTVIYRKNAPVAAQGSIKYIDDTFTFTAQGTVDKVTGKLVNLNPDGSIKDENGTLTWNAASHDFAHIDSPAVTGMHVVSVTPAEQKDGDNVKSVTINHDSNDIVVNVYYAPNGTSQTGARTVPSTQTVKYVDEQGNELHTSTVDSFTFSRTPDVTDAEGHVTQGTWNTENHTYETVDAPVIVGYVATQKTAGGKTATVDNPNVVDQIVYKKISNIIPVDKDGNQIPGTTPVDYVNDPHDATKVVPDESSPAVPGGWKISTTQTPGVTPDPTTNTAKVTPVDPTKPTKVVYDKVAEKGILNVVFRDQDENNAVISGVGSQGSEQDVGSTPSYTTANEQADQTSLENKGYVYVSTDGTIPSEIVKGTTTVTIYMKHGHQPVNPDKPGDPGQPINPGNPDGPKYPSETDKVTKDVTRTIHYVGLPEDKTPGDVPQTVHFTREGVLDKVTGKWILSDGIETDDVSKGFVWSSDQTVANVVSPNVTGYHVISVDNDSTDGKNVDSKTLSHANDSYIVTVTYVKDNVPTPKPDTETVTIKYYDDDQNNPQDLSSYNKTITGEAGSELDYSTQPSITDLTNKGYKLVSDSFTSANLDGKMPAKGGNYEVHFVHGTTTVTPDNPGHPGDPVDPKNPDGPKYPTGTDENAVKRTGTQIIHYTGAGENTPADNKQSFDFTRTITFDDVTGEIIVTTPWNVESHTFGSVDTPVVQGYHADKRTAGNQTVTPDDLNKTVTVNYSNNGKIIPVDPNGNPIPNAPTPTYPTDPNDPTKVVPDEPVPNVPGWNPTQNTVTPVDPGKDTPVVYNKPNNPQPKPQPQPTPTPTPTPTTPVQPISAPSNPTEPTQPEGPDNVAPHPQTPEEVTPQGDNNIPDENVAPHANKTPGTPEHVDNVKPHAQRQGRTVLPNGQVVDKHGKVTGYVDKNSIVHNTLPQTGEEKDEDVASMLMGGAAVAISLLGLAGRRKKKH